MGGMFTVHQNYMDAVLGVRGRCRQLGVLRLYYPFSSHVEVNLSFAKVSENGERKPRRVRRSTIRP